MANLVRVRVRVRVRARARVSSSVHGEPADHERQQPQRGGHVLALLLAVVDGVEGAEQLQRERLGADEDDGDGEVREGILPPEARHAVHPAIGQPGKTVAAVGDRARQVGDPQEALLLRG